MTIEINENYQSHLQVGLEASVAVWMYNCITDLTFPDWKS